MRAGTHREYVEDAADKAYDSRLMRRLLGYLRPYRWRVLVCVGLLLGATGATLVRPYLVRVAVDVHMASKNIDGLARVCILFTFLIVVEALFRYLQTLIMSYVGQRVMYDMRMQVFRHLQKMSLRFFDSHPVGRLMTRITSDVEVLNETLSVGVVTIFGDVFVLIGTVVATLLLDWRLALVSYVTVPLLIAMSAVFRRLVRDAFREQRRKLARINAFLQERIAGMRVVQLFVQEKSDAERFEVLNREHRDEWRRAIRYFAVFMPSVEFVGVVSLVLILWVGGRLYYGGKVEIGLLLAFAQYSQMFFRPIRDITEKYNILQASMASSERIFHLLDTPEQIVTRADRPLRPATLDGRVEFRNVSFAYDHEEFVLRDISFSVDPGERVAIVGVTGAGKTSIVNLLSRFYDVQQGEILVDGHDVRDYDKYALRAHVGVVLQDVFLFSGTVEQNISLGDPSITADRVRWAAGQVNAHSFIRNLPHQYQTEVGERGANISMGQRQLLAFARVLAHNPSVLVLDEATSSVDTATEILIEGAIRTLMTGRTSLTIAHRLSTVQNADRIIVIHNGQIREIGTQRELMAQRGIFYRLYCLQYAHRSAG